MQNRGNNKRHTLALGSTDEIHDSQLKQLQQTQSQPSSASRTRRTGLLTVMERPPGTVLHSITCLFILVVCS